jgi:hypothetical protein
MQIGGLTGASSHSNRCRLLKVPVSRVFGARYIVVQNQLKSTVNELSACSFSSAGPVEPFERFAQLVEYPDSLTNLSERSIGFVHPRQATNRRL